MKPPITAVSGDLCRAGSHAGKTQEPSRTTALKRPILREPNAPHSSGREELWIPSREREHPMQSQQGAATMGRRSEAVVKIQRPCGQQRTFVSMRLSVLSLMHACKQRPQNGRRQLG